MIARRSFLIFSNKLITVALGYISLFFIARYMGPTALGMIGYALSFVGIFSFIADLGFNDAHIKKMNEENKKECIGTYMTIKIILIMMFLTFALGMILFVKFTSGFDSIEQEYVIYIILVYFFFTSFTDGFQQTFVANKEIAKREIPVLISYIIHSPVKILVAILSLGVIALAGAYLLGVILIFVASLFFFRKHISLSFDMEIAKKYFKFALPLMVSSAIIVVSLHIDNIMIEAFWHTKEVGYFFGMKRISEILNLISISVATILFPILAGYYTSKKIENVKTYIQKAERYVSLILIPIVLSIILYAEEIVSLIFSHEFLPAANVLRLLAVLAYFTSINRLYMMQLLGAGRPGIVTGLNILDITLHLVMNFIFIPASFLGFQLFGMGSFGAALSALIAGLATTIALRIFTKRMSNICFTKNIFYHILSAFTSGVAFYLVKIWLVGISVILIPIMIILTTLLYFGILILFREFNKEDISFFLDILSTKKMRRYVSDELRS